MHTKAPGPSADALKTSCHDGVLAGRRRQRGALLFEIVKIEPAQ
jgi:hypothetical protein